MSMTRRYTAAKWMSRDFPFILLTFNLDEYPISHSSMYLNAEFIVKLSRANLPPMAAEKLFSRKKYLRMQVKISVGNACVRFPKVTGSNLPGPAGNLLEAFIVHISADFV